MPPDINAQIRDQVAKEWLSGSTRDEIAKNNGIDAGTFSNIVNEWKKGCDSKDYDSIRELSDFLKGEGMTFNGLASIVRLCSERIFRIFGILSTTCYVVRNIFDAAGGANTRFDP